MKKYKLGIVMNAIESINPKKDTSLALLLAAAKRDYELYYFTAHDIYYQQQQVFAKAQLLTVKDDSHHWYQVEQSLIMPLDECDVILLRTDPPVDLEYFYLTYLLDIVAKRGTLVVNHPTSVRSANEKLFITQFPDCIPPTLVTSESDIIQAFIKQQQDVILKPLDGMGGREIFRVRENDVNLSVILETITHHGQRTIMAQRYLSDIKQGDKRILLINGEAIPYCLARIPAEHETRANLAVGGHGEGRELTARDHFLCQQIGPTLAALGLNFVGLDVIGDYVTEINVTSPTCVRELDTLFQLDIAGQFIDFVSQQLKGN